MLALTETGLHNDVFNSELFPDSYVVHRKDRKFQTMNQQQGGGVLLALKNCIKSEILDVSSFDINFPAIDLLAVKCSINCKSIIVLVLYMPPSIALIDFELFFDSLEQYDILQANSVVLLGDFNVPNFVNLDPTERKTNCVMNFLNFFDFKQCNNIPNNMARLLDLVITNVNCEIIRDNSPLVKEDVYHPSLIISFHKIGTTQPKFSPNTDQKAYNFKKADFVSLYNSLLGLDWSFLNELEDIEVAVHEFYEQLYKSFDENVPLYKTYKRSYPPWFDANIIKNVKKKARLFKKYKKTHNEHFLQEFRELRYLVKEQISAAYNNYIDNVQASISNDPQYFWSYVHSKNGTSRIPGKISYDNTFYDKPQDIVDVFGEFFKNVYLPPETDDKKHTELPNIHENITFQNISENDILNATKKLKNKMTSGPDNIPSFIIKDCIGVLAVPLRILFNLALKTKTFPSRWKVAKVCPVFKSGDRALVDNYRAISILSNFSKVFEIILYDRIYLSVRNQISPDQHGFMSNRSTVTNLAVFSQYVSNILDRQGQVDVVYTDFSKAFDRIDHAVLLRKLTQFGFHPSAIEFLRSYLWKRQQYVAYNGFSSSCYIVTSGVPQGSNLGPLLFLLFINDLNDVIDCCKLFYADDLKIYSVITSIDDCRKLQSDLNHVQSWCLDNKLGLNVSKCKINSFSRKETICEFAYHIGNDTLSRCTSSKDLGVLFDCKFTFNEHITLKVSEAMKFYGFIVRNCKNFTDINALKLLYFSYVRSRLEYAALIWYPYYNRHKTMVERVQRKFLKYLTFKADGVYPERGINYNYLTSRFNIISLDLRRICISLTFLYKLLHNTIDCCALLGIIKFNVPRINSRHNPTFRFDIPRTNILLKSPMYVMCQNYNNLCDLCDINCCSLDTLIEIAILNLDVSFT